MGQFDLYQRDDATAFARIGESLRLFKNEVNERLGLTQALFHMARVFSLQKDYARAYALYRESYAIASEMDNKLLIASCLEGLASLAAAQGKPILSAQLWGAAESLREAIEAPIPTIEREDNERYVATTRALMGDQAFNASWVEGKTMTPEQAFTSLISRMQSVTVVPSSTPSASHRLAILRDSPPERWRCCPWWRRD